MKILLDIRFVLYIYFKSISEQNIVVHSNIVYSTNFIVVIENFFIGKGAASVVWCSKDSNEHPEK